MKALQMYLVIALPVFIYLYMLSGLYTELQMLDILCSQITEPIKASRAKDTFIRHYLLKVIFELFRHRVREDQSSMTILHFLCQQEPLVVVQRLVRQII